VHAHLAVGIDDADVHPVDVPIDAAVKRVLNRVESPRVPSVLRGMGRPLQDTGCAAVCQTEEAFIIIISLQRTRLLARRSAQFVSTVFADTHLQRPSKEETWLLKFS
jgi:uncharacterized lipoprotein NlpE involved in copper resistance